uniref:RING-type domain-containing protein n=1 Tax=Ananas comosus var. bracteatus TaxID=296719 RepID=A0A6V7QE74_ANACO|nr:unnamed protein product [Ananas comosus var. bracteatus]
MTIASKLFYFQRSRGGRRSSGEEAEELASASHDRDPSRRNSSRRGRSLGGGGGAGGGDHRRPSSQAAHGKGSAHRVHQAQHEVFQLDFSGPSEYRQANSSNVDATSSRHGRLRLIKDADDRLPDAVRQAKQRLLNRLQSVDLTGTRHRTPDSETIWDKCNLIRSVNSEAIGVQDLLECCGCLSTVPSCRQIQPLCGMRNKPPFLRSEALLRLQTLDRGETKESGLIEAAAECCICLESFSDGDRLTQLRCGHTFHTNCVQRWVEAHGDCPYCRTSIALPATE